MHLSTTRPSAARRRVAPLAVVLTLALAAFAAPAAVIGTNPPAPPLNAERVDQVLADRPAERQAWRDYLARSAAQRQADQAALRAERQPGEPVPPPPASGKSEATMPLDKGDAWYRSDAARTVVANILSYQTPAGGWGKNQPRDQPPRLKGQAYVGANGSKFETPGDFDRPLDKDWSYVGTIDNDATLTEVRFLVRAAGQAAPEDATAWRAAALRGIRYLLAAQFPNGGWPQVWPLQGGYHDALTLNDNAMGGVMTLLQDAAGGSGDWAFVPAPLRAEAAEAVRRGVERVLALQVRIRGERAIWGQQHDPLTGAPVSARNYEPPALCTLESAELLQFLMRLPAPSAEVRAAVEAGISFLRASALKGVAFEKGGRDGARRLVAKPGAHLLWPRYIDADTLRGVFGDRDKSLHDDVNDLSAERRNGYAWFVHQPREALADFDRWPHRRRGAD